MNKKIGIYGGSFDPITNGHLDIAYRASSMVDELHIVVAISPTKKPLIPMEDRIRLIEENIKDFGNIKVFPWEGLLVDYAEKFKGALLVRGLRPTGDFDSEFQMATMNKKLMPQVDTIFLAAGEDYYYVSSALIREIHAHQGDIGTFVPENISRFLSSRVKDSV